MPTPLDDERPGFNPVTLRNATIVSVALWLLAGGLIAWWIFF